MTTHIALLRGINVGGHRVKMERLRALFGELGFCNVRSFIQSGNIFFEMDERDVAALTTRIETHLAASLGYAVPTFLRTTGDLERALLPNPFVAIEVTPDTRTLVVFTAQLVKCELPMRSPDANIEILGATTAELFVVYRVGNGRPPDITAFLKRAFGTKASATTTRFYDTALKMLREAQKGAPQETDVTR